MSSVIFTGVVVLLGVVSLMAYLNENKSDSVDEVLMANVTALTRGETGGIDERCGTSISDNSVSTACPGDTSRTQSTQTVVLTCRSGNTGSCKNGISVYYWNCDGTYGGGSSQETIVICQ